MMMKKLLVALACMTAFVMPLQAAVTPNSFVTTQTPSSVAANSTSSPVTLFTAGTNGSKCNGMMFSTNSTTAVAVSIIITATSSSTVATFSLPAQAGASTTVPAFAPMTSTTWPGLPVDTEGNTYLLLPASATVQYSFSGQSSGAAIEAFVSCGNF